MPMRDAIPEHILRIVTTIKNHYGVLVNSKNFEIIKMVFGSISSRSSIFVDRGVDYIIIEYVV